MYLNQDAKITVDDSTGGYCQARMRRPLAMLQNAFTRLAQWCAARPRKADLWQGRVVKIMDYCGLSMPDTDKNRAVYPYAGGQLSGCGFPTGQLLGLFNLCTGHLVKFVVNSWKLHEAPLARQLVGWVNQGEVLLADRAFSSWVLIALFQKRASMWSCVCTRLVGLNWGKLLGINPIKTVKWSKRIGMSCPPTWLCGW